MQAKAAVAERRRVRRQLRQGTLREGWDTSSASEEDGAEEAASDRSAFCAAVDK